MKRLGALTCIAVTLFAVLAATVRLAAQEPQPNTSTTKQAENFTVLYSFSGSDGANPFAGLVMDRHSLYGTTVWGGAYGFGTVFKLNPSRHDVTVLYNFTGGNDGKWPVAGVIPDRAGNLYGTTHSGGA
jgi:uncharacterized repeat protein (TIGR03803 family)